MAENNNQTDKDESLVLRIGERLNMTVADMDGSQSLSLNLSGFPQNAQDLYFGISSMPDGVNATVNRSDGTVTMAGNNIVEVLKVLDSLTIVLAHDDDTNFVVEIKGSTTDPDGSRTVSGTFEFSHSVVIQAVADKPIVLVPDSIETVNEGSTNLQLYPVTLRLNDTDGSESYKNESVIISFSVASGELPVIEFGNKTEVEINRETTGQIMLTGTDAAIEAALETMMIRPGDNNGEDILVNVTATAIEFNTTESGSDEIAIETRVGSNSFTIPVEPIIQGSPVITLNKTSARGNEDGVISLGVIKLDLNGTEDPDGSEMFTWEILSSSYPNTTQFLVNGILEEGVLSGGWLRLPANESSIISIIPPTHFSGMISLSLRGRTYTCMLSILSVVCIFLISYVCSPPPPRNC
jgi:hypothetical protein